MAGGGAKDLLDFAPILKGPPEQKGPAELAMTLHAIFGGARGQAKREEATREMNR